MRRKLAANGGWRAALLGRATLIAFAVFVLAVGGSPIAVRFSDRGLPPFWGAAFRFAGAALIFWIVVLVRRIAVPRGRALIGTAVYGAIAIGAAFAFLYWALLRVQPGLASVFLALVPLLTLFLAAAHGQEGMNWWRLAGALVAVVGIAIIVGGGLGRALDVPGLLALLAGTVCIAEGAVVFKRLPRANPAATNAVALSTGAVLLAGLSLVAGETWSMPASASTWAAFAYLIAIGSVAGFYMYLYVLVRWPASSTAYGYVLAPVVSVALSAWLTGESVTASFGVGAAVVLVGLWLGAVRGSLRAAAAKRAATVECATC